MNQEGVMAVWGKLLRPRKEVSDPDEPYFYSTELGPVDNAEGTGYVIPHVEEGAIEKTEFVPRDLAQTKLEEISKESLRNREAYLNHLRELTEYYQNVLKDRKQHYEDIIREIKNKALRHVEIQKQMRKQSEDKLNQELQKSEESLEELRDSMAALNREYQEEVRALKVTVGDTSKRLEETLSSLRKVEDNAHCKVVLDDLVAAVIENVMRGDVSEEHRRAMEEQEQLHADIAERIGQEQQHIRLLQEQHSFDEDARRECFAALSRALCTLEVRSAENQQQRLAALQAQLDEQYEAAQLMDQETQRHFRSLESALAPNQQGEGEGEREVDEGKHHSQDVRRKFASLIHQVTANKDLAEVQLCMSALIAQVMDRHTSEVVGSAGAHAASSQAHHASEVEQLVARYEQQLQEMHDDFEEKSLKLKAKFNTILKDMKLKSHRDEVALVLADVITGVVERNPPLASTLAWKTPLVMTPAANSMKDGETVSVAELQEAQQQQQMLYQRVQQLEQELQRRDQQQQQKQAGAAPESWAQPSERNPLASAKEQSAPGEETKKTVDVAEAGEAVGGEPDERSQLHDELARLQQSEAELQTQIPQCQQAVAQLAEALERLTVEKDACKEDIKQWSKLFQEENGRDPDVKDKAKVKDKYQKYKALSTKTKEAEGQQQAAIKAAEDKAAELPVLQEKIKQLQAQLDTLGPASSSPSATTTATSAAIDGITQATAAAPTAAPDALGMVPRVPMSDASVQTESATAAAAAAAQANKAALEGLEGDKLRIAQLEEAHNIDSLAIEQLEDQLYQLKQDFESTLEEKAKNDLEREFLTKKVDLLVGEKRTDLVKRMEDELLQLRQTQGQLNEQLAVLNAEKVKSDARLKELRERAEEAEAELRARDEVEQKALSENKEKSMLKGQISKQREQIIMKSKAATAGWDAAANADEKLDIEMERAYNRGVKEERDRHKGDFDALNASLEKKEERLTEMAVAVADSERKVALSNQAMLEMQAKMDAMQLEVADTIAGLMAMGGGRRGGGGGGGEDGDDEEAGEMGPTVAEMEAAREQLDSAQEELVNMIDRCERLEIELEQARTKNRVLERLAAMTGLTDTEKAAKDAIAHKTAKGGGGGGGASGAVDNINHDINEVIRIIKVAIVKGTNLWKSNRKDDCYDLYFDTCHQVHQRLLTAEMRDPLGDAMNNGKVLGAQNKQRGAVVLRKALDKILSDSEKPNLRGAEEEANAHLVERKDAEKQLAASQNTEEVKELVEELQELEQMFLDQGYTKEQNPSNSSAAGTVKASPREGGDPAASLLARAKAAEAQVVSLKKQMATVLQAAAAGVGTGGVGGAVAAAGGGGESGGDGHDGTAVGVSGTVTPVGGAPAGAVSRAVPASLVDARRRSLGPAGGGGADPAEVRRLKRKVAELEKQLSSGDGGGGGSGGGGGAGVVDTKAAAANDKAMQKKIKDMETAHKRATKSLEMRATKAENALNKINASHGAIVAERDKLRTETKKLKEAVAEMGELRDKAARCSEIEAALADKMGELEVIQDQFKKETALRKKYKNELEDLKGAIRVYARCRPMAKYEIERGCKKSVLIKDETGLKVTTGRGEKDFEFDAVFGPESRQEEVFEDTRRLVESCMDGFNVCLFAYGQTGSGKTFTMTGSADLPGLTPRAIDELYRLIAERKHLTSKVTTYFVELYNDNLVDLYYVLDNKGNVSAEDAPKLDIKMDNRKMVYIRNAVIKDAYSPAELMDLFHEGNKMRHTGATKMNAESSRSHSIFAIMVESYDKATKRTTMGKLSLVDLAGSERADKTGASADRLREAQSINKSLSALGDVIAALSEGTKFIPYRNNKLTQVMQDSLGGNAKTLMFVNFSPADYNCDETTTSLMYAARVKKIVNNASKQAESAEVARLKGIIKRLQAGQAVADVDAIEDEDEDGPPPPDDDGKVYDGY